MKKLPIALLLFALAFGFAPATQAFTVTGEEYVSAPTPEEETKASLDELSGEIRTVSARVGGLESSLVGKKGSIPALAEKIGSLESSLAKTTELLATATNGNKDAITALGTRVGTLAKMTSDSVVFLMVLIILSTIAVAWLIRRTLRPLAQNVAMILQNARPPAEPAGSHQEEAPEK